MEAAAAAMDGYEDMFKEITRKLYGEEVEAAEYDDLAAALAGGGGAGAGPGAAGGAAGGGWVQSEEALPWSASKVAAYSPQQKLFRCVECGDCVGVLARVAEHWVTAHAAPPPAFAAPGHGWAARCVRVDDVSRFLQRLRARADSSPRGGGGVSHHQHSQQQQHGGGGGKRYCCGFCPYATDRRDLFTRHENIHREEKPFQCYVCHKQFNRADHVKKHFLRMHRDFPYDLNRIRRTPARASYRPTTYAPPPPQQQQTPQQQPAGALGGGKPRRKGDKRYACCYCPWSGADNWCLKRHLNTHLKPFACALCEYKAARAERLATHVLKVHNKRACARCAFLGDDAAHLAAHVGDAHPWEQRNGAAFATPAMMDAATFGARVKIESGKRQHCGAERLFHYLEASDDEEPDRREEETPPPAVCPDCGCEFLDAASLETHALTHRAGSSSSAAPLPLVRRLRRPPPSPPYRCAVCGGGRATQAAMLEHMRSHGAGAVLRCRFQGCAFATACGRDALRDHVAVRHLRRDAPATCPDCTETTPCSRCDVCLRGRRAPKKAPNDSSEIRVQWRGRRRCRRRRPDRGLRCPFCPRRLRTAASLASHRAWRHATPDFRCEHCPRSFRHRYQVVLHASREHVAPRATPILNVPRIGPL